MCNFCAVRLRSNRAIGFVIGWRSLFGVAERTDAKVRLCLFLLAGAAWDKINPVCSPEQLILMPEPSVLDYLKALLSFGRRRLPSVPALPKAAKKPAQSARLPKTPKPAGRESRWLASL